MTISEQRINDRFVTIVLVGDAMPRIALKVTALAAAGLLVSISVVVAPAEARKRNVDGLVGGIIVGGAIAAMALEAQRAAEQQKGKSSGEKRSGAGSGKKKSEQPAVGAPKPNAPAKPDAPSKAVVHEAVDKAPATQSDHFKNVSNRPPQTFDPFGQIRPKPRPLTAPSQIDARPSLPAMPTVLAAATAAFVASAQGAASAQALPSPDQVAALARGAYKGSELTAFERQPGNRWDPDVATAWIILDAARAIRSGKAAPTAEADAALAYRATFAQAAREVYLQTLAAREASALSLSHRKFEDVMRNGAVTQGASWEKQAILLRTEVERDVIGPIDQTLGTTREDDIRAYRARQILVDCVALHLNVAVSASSSAGVTPTATSPELMFGTIRQRVVAECGASANAAVAPSQPLMRTVPLLQRASLSDSPMPGGNLAMPGVDRH